jgi:tetratricopeptide (TPR) repeat protein
MKNAILIPAIFIAVALAAIAFSNGSIAAEEDEQPSAETGATAPPAGDSGDSEKPADNGEKPPAKQGAAPADKKTPEDNGSDASLGKAAVPAAAKEHYDKAAKLLIKANKIQDKKSDEFKNTRAEAVAELEEAMKAAPECVDIVYPLAVLYYYLNKMDKVIKLLEPVVEKNPDYFPAAITLAKAYGSKQKYEKSEALFLKVLEKKPDDEEVISNLRILYDSWGKKDKLVEVLKKLLEKSPSAALQYQLGQVYRSMKKYTEAVKVFEELFKTEPTHHNGLIVASECYRELKKWDKAVELLELFLKTYPEDKLRKIMEKNLEACKAKKDEQDKKKK